MPSIPAKLASVAVTTVFSASLSLGCGSSPTSPSQSPPLADGNFLLSLIGDSSLCQDIKAPQAGTRLNINLTATHDDNSTWIAHGATAADGAIETRLSRTTMMATAGSGPAGLSDYYVNGWISGTANDAAAAASSGPANHTVTFDGQMNVSGIVRPLAKLVDGYSGGSMTFSRNGVSSTCPGGSVSWSINW